MDKKSQTGPVLARFDEHGMFELDAHVTDRVSGGLPPMPPIVMNLRQRVHDTLNQGPNNQKCLALDLACGGNTLCG